ncbi:DUF1202 family protein [Escherichia fergusonii]|nr:DUF1202 family protein [Escherichia fergusonii]
MKRQWIVGTTLFVLMSGYVWAEAVPPDEKTLKMQFNDDFAGIMRLDQISLKPVSSEGNQSTWSAEGDMSATEDLYVMAGMAADYRFMEKTWVKDQSVKFSAMVKAKGTPDSGWTTEFFSMQMAAKNMGYPLPKPDEKIKYLITTDSNFYAQLAKVEAGYGEMKDKIERSKEQEKELQKQYDDVGEKIKTFWGKDAKGEQRTRYNVQQEMLQKMYEADRQNDPLKFENNYYETVYSPALAACQAKSDCDAAPLRAERDAVVAEKKRYYVTQHQLMLEKIKTDMAELDKKVKPLSDKQTALNHERIKLAYASEDLQAEYDRWNNDITELRRRGVIK